MLKREFIMFCQLLRNRLFERYIRYHKDARYGVTTTGLDTPRIFLIFELLDKIERANKRVSPTADVLLPAFINEAQFDLIISDIKTQL